MSNEPVIGKFLDREEEDLFRAIESDAYAFGQSALTPERKTELQKAARTTLNDERVQIIARFQVQSLKTQSPCPEGRHALSDTDQFNFA